LVEGEGRDGARNPRLPLIAEAAAALRVRSCLIDGEAMVSGRPSDWLKMKNPNAQAVKREEEEDWGKKKWR
jgi:hypothetical protein